MRRKLYEFDRETMLYKNAEPSGGFIKGVVYTFVTIVIGLLVWKCVYDNKTIERQKAVNAKLTETVDLLHTRIEECTINESIGEFQTTTAEECGPVNDSILWEFIKSCDPWYPEYVMAQAIIESRCGESDVYKSSNNLFGMREAKTRRTTADVDPNKPRSFARYKNWKLSVIDRLLWELYCFKEIKPSRERYVQSLTIYAEDQTYIDKVKQIAAKYTEPAEKTPL